MVSPEGTGRAEKPGKTARTTLVGAGIALLAVGAIALGGLTAPSEEEAAPEPTTTTTIVDRLDSPLDIENFSVAQIERGQSFDWDVALNVVDLAPLDVVVHGGWTYVFATREPNFTTHTLGGLRVWRSEDGVEWENLGEVIDQTHVIGAVDATGQGLVALEAGQSGENPTIWLSGDGIEWTPETIPAAADGAHSYVQPYAIAATDQLMILASDTGADVSRMLEARFAETYPELDLFRFGWGTDVGQDGQVSFTVWGPLGFSIAEITGEDLGLTAEEKQLIADEYILDRPGTEVWVRAGADWLTNEIEGASWIESITIMPDGEILASGWGNSGSMVWTSPEGLTWMPLGTTARPSRIDTWNESLVGPASTGQAQIFMSNDGELWRQIGPYEHFPIPIQWRIDQMAAGPAGIGAVVSGWEPGDQGQSLDARRNPPLLHSEDVTLILDFWSGTYTIETPDYTDTWRMSGDSVPDGIDLDLETASATFLNIDTGEELASFSFDEIAEAQDAYWATQVDRESHHRAFVFTADGDDWTIDEIGPILGDRFMTHLEVADDHVVGLVVGGAGRFSPGGSPGFEIWSAPVP